MKVFFSAYILLLVGVFLLWGIEPLHRAEITSSVAAYTPVASTTNTPTKATTVATAAAPKKEEPKKIIAPFSTSSLTSPSSSTSTTYADVGSTSIPLNEEVLAAQIELGIHNRINEERKKAGLPALILNTTLSDLARAHSKDMLLNNYFTHTDASGCSSSCRITNAGYLWSAAGENIYMMSGYTITIEKAVEMVVLGWMESPGHRANILSTAFTEEGIGIVFEGTKLYATQDFARPQ